MDEPTFQDHVVDSLGRSLIICTIVLALLMLLTTIGRIFARRLKDARIGGDDAAIVLATVLSLALAIVQVWGVFYAGYGETSIFDAESYARNQKADIVTYMLFSMISGLVKVAVLLFYKRIFKNRRFLLMSNCLIVMSALWAILDFFLLPRFPLHLNWELQPPPRPTNIFAIFLSFSIIDILLDLAILGLPGPRIWRLNLSSIHKILLIFIFMMGALAVVASVLRLVYTVWGFQHEARLDTDPLALQANGRRVIFWLSLDCPISVIAANLPVLGLPAELGQKIYRALRRVFFALTRRTDTAAEDSKSSAIEMASQQGEPRLDMEVDSRQQTRSVEGRKLRHIWRAIRVSGEENAFETFDDADQNEQSPVLAEGASREHAPSSSRVTG